MRSSILRSARAVQVNIEIMRAFVRLRRMVASNAELPRLLHELEKKYDAQFEVVFDAIRELMTPPRLQRRSIGFRFEEKKPRYRVRRSPGEITGITTIATVTMPRPRQPILRGVHGFHRN